MRRVLFAALIWVAGTVAALAQCGSQMPGGTVCGNKGTALGLSGPLTSPALGIPGVSQGSLGLAGTGGGSVTLQPSTSALGSSVATLRAGTYNVVGDTLANTFTAAQVITTNATALQAAQTGSVLRIASADGVSARYEADAYGATAYFSAVVSGGTNASRTALSSGTELGGFNVWGYNGAAFVGPRGAFRCYANQTWTTGANGTYCDVATTPNGATTEAEAVRFENDGGITVPSTVTGGDKGAGTINAAGLYVLGVAVPTTASSVASVGNATSDTSLTLAGTGSGPYTGAVTVKLNLSNAQTWAALQKFTNGDLGILGSSTGYTLLESGLSGAGNNTLTLPITASDTLAAIGTAQTWTAVQTFTNSDFKLLGSSTGATTFTSANASVTNYTAAFPANTGTVAELNLVQTWIAVQTFNSGNLVLAGASSGNTTLNAASAAGTTTATLPNNTGIIAELNLAQTWSAAQTINQGDLILGSNSTGTITLTTASAGASNFTVTLQAATDTLVGRATTDTLTNKTLTTPIINGAAFSGTLSGTPTFSGNVTFSADPLFTGLASGTCSSGLAINSSNQLIEVACPGVASSIQQGVTTLTGGCTSGDLLWSNSAVLGCSTISGFLTAGAGITFSGSNNVTIALSLNNASTSANPSNPSPTTSTTGAMQGIGASTCRLTPVYSGRVFVHVDGNESDSSGSTQTVQYNIRYGTGAGPANNAAPTGTILGPTKTINDNPANSVATFVGAGVITGLSTGTALWIDLDGFSTSGPVAFTNITCVMMEY